MFRFLLLSIIPLFTLNIKAQSDTIKIDLTKLTKEQADRKFHNALVEDKKHFEVKKFYPNRNFESLVECAYWNKNIKHGKMQYFYPNGKNRYTAQYFKDQLNGVFKSFYINGAIQRIDTFKLDSLIGGVCFDSNGNRANYTPLKATEAYHNLLVHFDSTSDFMMTTYVESKEYMVSGRLKSFREYSDETKKVKHGKHNLFYYDGKPELSSFYLNNKLNGKFITYYKSGLKKREDYYKNGKLIKGKCFDISGADTTYYNYKIEPEIIGGQSIDEYLNEHVNYPYDALGSGITGTVLVSFKVTKYGEIKDIKLLKGLSPLFNGEAIKLVYSMPNWKPGRINGIRQEMEYVLPVEFK